MLDHPEYLLRCVFAFAAQDARLGRHDGGPLCLLRVPYLFHAWRVPQPEILYNFFQTILPLLLANLQNHPPKPALCPISGCSLSFSLLSSHPLIHQ